MINGFEIETKPLSETEKLMLPELMEGFKNKYGEENAVKSEYIISQMKKRGHKIGGARLRKLVNFIRIEGMIPNLMATSKGYYRETDPDKLKTYVESLKQRAEAIMSVAMAMQRNNKRQVKEFNNSIEVEENGQSAIKF